MKKQLLLLITAVLTSIASAFAQSGTTGALTWNLDGGTLTISGTGVMPDYTSGGAPWYEYRESINAVTIEVGVTTIGSYAFRNCISLKSISIPSSVITIGRSVFSYCRAIKSITIPYSITTIEMDAFYSCTGLISITNLNPIPVTISSNVFSNVNQSACTLQVPTNAVSAYENAEVWKNFTVTEIEGYIPSTTITVLSNNNDFGAVWSISNGKVITSTPSSTSALYGGTITLIASPKAGKIFVGWADGSVENPRTVNVTKNVTYTANFADFGHTYTAVVTPPTCAEEGFTTYTNSCDGKSYTADKVPNLESTYTTVVTPPTCTEEGYTTYTNACDGSTRKDDFVPALDNAYTTVVTPPTCTEEGFTIHTRACDGDSYTDDIVPAFGHNYSSVVTPPTCTEDGFTTHTSACDGSSHTTDMLSALGHNFKWIIDPNNENQMIEVCSVCGEPSGAAPQPITCEHVFNEWYITTAATCETDGVKTEQCSKCKVLGSKTEAIAKLGHNFANYMSDDNATCSADGTETGVCSRCTETNTRTIANSKLETTYSTVVTAPTCSDEGFTTYTSDCDGSTHDDDFVPALGHTYTAEVTPPTCAEDGYTTYTSDCDGSTYIGDIVPAGTDVIIKSAQLTSPLKVYPNPTSDILNVRLENAVDNGVLTLSDMNGKIVLQQAVTGDSAQINMSQFAAGNYILRVVENGVASVGLQVIKK